MQTGEFLGDVIDTTKMEIRIPNRKITAIRKRVERFREVCDANKATLRNLMSVHGLLGSARNSIAIIGYRLLDTKFYIADTVRESSDDLDRIVRVPKCVFSELRTFSEFAKLWNRRPLVTPAPTLCIATDASGEIGWGAIVLFGKSAYKTLSVSDRWTAENSEWHINKKEMFAVKHGARFLIETNQIFGCHVLFQPDSTTVLAYLRHRSNGNRVLAHMMRDFMGFLHQRGISSSATWVASADNKEADDLSRDTRLDHSDWKLHEDVFTSLVSYFGTFEIDLFSSPENTQLPLFVTWKPSAEPFHVDALSSNVNWRDFFFYANPPFILLGKVMRRIRQDSACGVVIVPNWPSASWYPSVTRLLVDRPLLLPKRYDLFTNPNARVSSPRWDTMACMLSAGSYVHKACRLTRRRSSKLRWPPAPFPDT